MYYQAIQPISPLVLANQLETDRDIDLNGVILLSQILNLDASADDRDKRRAMTQDKRR